MKQVILLVSLLFSLTAFSSIEKFQKRFKLIKKEGKVVQVWDNSLSIRSFHVKDYVNHIKDQLVQEQDMMYTADKGGYELELRNLLYDGAIEKGDRSSKYVNYIMRSMRKIGELDIDGIFESPSFKEVISKFEGRLYNALSMFNPLIIANLDDPRFFYKKSVIHKAAVWSINYAKKKFASVPLLNALAYVIVEIEKMITTRRLFHQNMLLHYLENFSEKEIGMTKSEVDLTMSSIYESRISWFAFWESNRARRSWDNFGAETFFKYIRSANNNLRKHKSRYSSVDEKLNYAFRKVTLENGESAIINVFDKQAMFKNYPAVAVNLESTKKVPRLRLVLKLAGLGLSFVPIKQIIKDVANSYIKSYYESQELTEGALYGYFESNQDSYGMNLVRKQYLNPFDSL